MNFNPKTITIHQKSPQLPIYLQNTNFQFITTFSPTLPHYIISHYYKFTLLLYSNTFIILLN